MNSERDEPVKDKLKTAVNDLNIDIKVTVTTYVDVDEIPKDSVFVVTHDLTNNAKVKYLKLLIICYIY